MTVAELIKELQALPQDLQIMMLDSEREAPVEIVQVSRGSWVSEFDDEPDDGFEMAFNEGDEFVQDDENGEIAVLVTW
jgi:hypothetical protein